ncbi:MAG: ParB/RepB/Spo0J family partition protein [Hydrococcus sp. RU_2_2]|nr:ParB/RepB/Spo0J family partition protein [Hydrococcus sp. RU_2_2]NJP20551.1 ParB/RepB/Spo0J family partition protein [Hydrococcus sp. CRU_1_1]
MSKKDKPFQALGVDALFGTSNDESTMKVPLSAIALGDAQPRRYFDPDKMEQLTVSVRRQGILQPLLVRPKGTGYELIAGERRYRAAEAVGLLEVPVVVKELSDEAARQLALIENLQREDLNAIEETEGILGLLALALGQDQESVVSFLYRLNNETKGLANQNVLVSEETQQIIKVFDDLGTISWESFVSSRLPLLKLPSEILEELRDGKIAYTKAVALSKIKDHEQRKKLLEEAIAQGWSLSQIKEKIAILQKQPKEDINEASKEEIEQFGRVSQKLKKAKPWQSDPTKWKK